MKKSKINKQNLDEVELKALAAGKRKRRFAVFVDTWVDDINNSPNFKVLQDGCQPPYLRISHVQDETPGNWTWGIYH